jgi:hypothetical protein
MAVLMVVELVENLDFWTVAVKASEQVVYWVVQ